MDGRILYLCPSNQKPTGGNKIVYRHVEILANHGFPAFVLHDQMAFRYREIPYHPPILSLAEVNLHPSDLLVLPEDCGDVLSHYAPGVKRIIFNQNAYYTFKGFENPNGSLPPYDHEDVEAVLVVSEDSKAYLEYAFPGLNCWRIRITINHEAFKIARSRIKKQQICFMARKNSGDWVQVLQILRSRNHLKGWTIKPIADQDEAGVASILQQSMIYLAFGHPEGLSLSNLEAVACGCSVIGYTGMGGKEFFNKFGCKEVEHGDIRTFVQKIEEEADRLSTASGLADLRLASEERLGLLQKEYGPAQETSDLLRFFNQRVQTGS